MVNEESDEAVYWLEFAFETGLASCAETIALLDEARELRAIFAASYATARRNYRARRNTTR
jgi:hypothetical protein